MVTTSIRELLYCITGRPAVEKLERASQFLQLHVSWWKLPETRLHTKKLRYIKQWIYMDQPKGVVNLTRLSHQIIELIPFQISLHYTWKVLCTRSNI